MATPPTLPVPAYKIDERELTPQIVNLIKQMNAVNIPWSQYTADTHTAGFTATPAQLIGATDVVLDLTGTLGAGAALTLPSAAALYAAHPNPYPGQSFSLRIVNHSSGAFAWTVTQDAGATVTLTGTMTIAQSTFRDFVVTLTSATAATIQQVGTGTAG